MACKRKSSESFHADTDMVENLMKYRKISTPLNNKKPIVKLVSQDELKSVLENFVQIYEDLDARETGQKPNFTYTELIFLSIMRSPNFCLPITEIYHYIDSRFPYFRETSKQQWKNAIRHSLSKTKCFTKIGPKNQKPRSGILNRSAFLWTIVPKSLLTFARGDYRPTNKFAGSNALRSAFHQVNGNGLWEGCVLSLSKRMEAFQNILDNSTSPTKLYELQICSVDQDGNISSGYSPDFTRVTSLSSPQSDHGTVQSDDTSVWMEQTINPNGDNISNYTTVLSDSSGYDTADDLSSPECIVDSNLLHRSQEKHINFYEVNHISSIAEVTPECIYSVPTIPVIPPLRLTFDESEEASSTEKEDEYYSDFSLSSNRTLQNHVYRNPCLFDLDFSQMPGLSEVYSSGVCFDPQRYVTL